VGIGGAGPGAAAPEAGAAATGAARDVRTDGVTRKGALQGRAGRSDAAARGRSIVWLLASIIPPSCATPPIG
jgi:hypothetical protein